MQISQNVRLLKDIMNLWWYNLRPCLIIFIKNLRCCGKLEIQYIKLIWNFTYLYDIHFYIYINVLVQQYFHFACIISLGSANAITLRIFGHSFVLSLSDVFYMISKISSFSALQEKRKKLWIQYLSPWSISTHFNFSMQTVKKENVNNLIIAIYIYILPFTLHQQ